MTTEQKKVARALAKALMALDIADWHARDWDSMHGQICRVRAEVSTLFTATGYQFGSEERPLNIKKRDA